MVSLSLTYLKKVKVKKDKLSATMEMLMPMYEMRLNAKECCFWGERRQTNLNMFFFSFFFKVEYNINDTGKRGYGREVG